MLGKIKRLFVGCFKYTLIGFAVLIGIAMIGNSNRQANTTPRSTATPRAAVVAVTNTPVATAIPPTNAAVVVATREPLGQMVSDRTPDENREIQQSMAQVAGVIEVHVLSSSPLPYAEVIVSPDVDYQTLANDLRALLGTQAYDNATFIIDDGMIAIDHSYETRRDRWSVTHMETFNKQRLVSDPGLFRLQGENVRLKVSAIQIMPTMGRASATEDNLVVVYGTFTTSSRECIHANDIRLIVGSREYAPGRGLMSAVQEARAKGIDYPGPVGGHCVNANQETPTFFVFDAPTFTTAQLRFLGEVVEIVLDGQDISANIVPTVVLATNTPRATETVAVTRTPQATSTPRPTNTPRATSTPRPTNTPRATSTPRPTEVFSVFNTDYETKIRDGLSIGAGGRFISSVDVVNGRPNGGGVVTIIVYISVARGEADLADEWIDIFSSVAATIRTHGLDIDDVSLIVGDINDQAIGIVSTSVVNLLAYHRGQISREVFLSRLIIEVL